MDKKKIILIILISLIALYSDFRFIIKMQLGGINTTKSKLTQLKKQIDKVTKELTAMQELKRKQEQMRKEMLARVKKFISKGQLTSLLEDISLTANKNKVKFTQIKPSKQIKQDDKALQGAKLTPLVITLDLSGGYHELGSFINDLENKEQFLAVESLKIENDTSNYLHQKVNLTLKTYVK